MKDRWMNFLLWCGKAYESVLAWNRKVLGKVVPKALAEMPLLMALSAWLACSVVWVVPLGVTTLAAYALLFPFLVIGECVSTAHRNGLEVIKRIGDMLIWGLIMLGLFVFYRLEAPVGLFQDGILEPRQNKGCILVA